MLTIKNYSSEISIENEFDADKELSIRISNNNDETVVYLTPNFINDIVTHLAKALKKEKEPITILIDK